MTTPTLEALEAGLAQELGPPAPHAPPAPDHLYDVVILGGGQAGLATAWGLLREGIRNILVLDRGKPGFEGPWATFARMPTLRTPKGPTGIDAGHPDLTIRAWYRASFGPHAWDSLTLIPTAHWMDYLRWLRRVTGAPVQNHIHLRRIRPGTPLRLECELDGAPFPLRTRKLVVATGYEGSGGLRIPPEITKSLPERLYAHSAHPIDFPALRGATVAVLGAGASAFDNAATAAEHGATVHLLVRRPTLPTVNLVRWMDFTAFIRNYPSLPDRLRAAYVRRFLGTPMPPPPETVQRAARLPNLHLHLAAPLLSASEENGQALLTTPSASIRADLVICGTGFHIDLARRPELAELWPHVLLWSHRYAPDGPPDWIDAAIDRYPYLGDAFQLRALAPAHDATLGAIHIFNSAAVASFGPLGAGINGLKFNISRLVAGLARDLAAGSASASQPAPLLAEVAE